MISHDEEFSKAMEFCAFGVFDGNTIEINGITLTFDGKLRSYIRAGAHDSHWPHACPRCGGPAWISQTVECKEKCK